ncbi:MAG: GNAT family N-acetyltransferase [Bacteroidota bacterium]
MSVIHSVAREEYQAVVALWEASVRATHHFLKEEDITYFKPLILREYLDAVNLKCLKRKDKMVGFLGVAEHNLEMLFVHPDYRGQYVGQQLLTYAIEQMAVTKVDVNEQNEQAIGFYERFGFVTIARSEQDASGKPYPILHMKLKE